MSMPVNRSSRPYDARRRQAQALETRRAMLDAARALFLEHGYVGTALPAVADAAGVSVQNVYKVFGNKAGLVKAVFDVAVAGDDEPLPLMQREMVAQVRAEPDPRRKLALYGQHMARTAPRIMPILLLVRDAAAGDPSAAELWAILQEERLTGMGRFAKDLRDEGHLREGVTRDEARDVLWTHNSLEVWDLLVRQRRWSLPRYGRFLAQQMAAALL
jgi:AcrR family transcriptional regulator